MKRSFILYVLALFFLFNTNHSIAQSPYLVGYWQNWDNGASPYIPLDQIDTRYSVVNLSFAVGGNGTDYDMVFNLCCGETQAGLLSKIQTLQANGVIVNISIGGANDPVHLDTPAEVNTFVTSMGTIIDTYGLDGLDIDLEGASLSVSANSTISNPTDAPVVNFISAIQQIMANYQSTYNKKMFLSAAPETAFVQGGQSNWGGIWGAYLPVLDALRDDMDLLHVQLYNSGSMFGIDGNIYAQSTVDFIVSQTEAVIEGFNTAGGFFAGFPANKISVGLPACPSAAGGGFTTTNNVTTAVNYLMGNGSSTGSYVLQGGPYPDLGGLMTWSINWDAVSSCNSSSYEYAANYETLFPESACIAPNLGSDISACGLTFPYLLNSNTSPNTNVSYTWINLSTNQILVSNDPSATTLSINGTGIYQVQRDSIGCSRTDIINVLENLATPAIPTNLDLCAVVPEAVSVSNTTNFPAGTTWTWYKDGQIIPNETNPNYTDVRSAGIYTVLAGYLNCSAPSTITVSSSLPEPVDACGVSEDQIDLEILTNSTGPFEWYDTNTGGTLLGTGTTFTSPALNTTTTYYVEDASSVGSAITGPTATSNGLGNLGSWFNTKEIYFDAEANFILKGMTIYPLIWCGTHSVSIEVRDANDNVLSNGSHTFSLTGDGNCGALDLTPATVTFAGGITIPQGTGYKIVAFGAVGINHWTGSVSYPMDYNPYFTITGSDVANTYLAIHDWDVEGASCARLSVVATIDPACGMTCAPHLDVHNHPINSNTYQAAQTIFSNGTIPSGNVVSLKAGTCIELQSGFSAELGCELNVEIEVCN